MELETVKKSISNISKIINKRYFRHFIKDFSQITNIPSKIIEFEVKQILYRDKNYQSKSFYNFYNKKSLLKNLILFLLLTIWNIFAFFLLKKKKQKKFEIIVEGVNSKLEVDRFHKLSNYFKSFCIITKLKLPKRKNIIYHNYNKFFITDHKFSLSSRVLMFNLFIKLLFYSIIKGENLFFVFFKLYYFYIKYNSIFENNISNFLIEEKFYNTSFLKNYIFKKHGGKFTSCIQKNLIELSIGFYVTCDIVFSLGKNTARGIKKLNGDIKKIYPVGSLFMETDWFNKKKDISKIEKSDILILGINVPSRIGKFVINKRIHKSYYEFIEWLVKFSIKFPKIKLNIKHHGSQIGDLKETNLLKDSNINVITKTKNINRSYGYAFKSKIICAFGSTMILESLGHNKRAFFLDPYYHGQQFYCYLDQAYKYRISKYNDFEKIMLKELKNKNMHKIANQDNFCLKSDNVSKKIAYYLKKQLKN